MSTRLEKLQEPCPTLQKLGYTLSIRHSSIQSDPATLTAWPNFETEVRAFPLVEPKSKIPKDRPYLADASKSEELTKQKCSDLFVHFVLRKVMTMDYNIGFQIGHGHKLYANIHGGRYGTFGYEKVAGIVRRCTNDWERMDDLILAWNDHTAAQNPVHRPIRRLFACMNRTGCKYGFVTVYNKTWFFRRNPDDLYSLQVSPVVRIQATDPSVAQCLWCLVNQKTDETSYEQVYMDSYTTDEDSS